MSEDNWYYSQDGDQQGPVPLSLLRDFVEQGRLTGEDLVWEAGSPGWVEVHEVPELVGPMEANPTLLPPTPPPRARLDGAAPRPSRGRELMEGGDRSLIRKFPHLRYADDLFQGFQRQVTVHQLDRADRMMGRFGSFFFMAASLFFALYFSISGIRADSIQQLLTAVLIIVPLATAAHYLAAQLLDSSSELLESSPTVVASDKLPKSLGIVLLMLGVTLLVLGSRGLIQGGIPGHDLILGGVNFDAIFQLAFGLSLLYAAATCFVRESLNVRLRESTDASREALGLGYLLAKIPLRSIPVTFGLFSLVAALVGAFFLLQLFGESKGQYYPLARELAPWFLVVGFLPLLSYLASVVGSLLAGHLEALIDTAVHTRELKYRDQERSPTSS